MVAQNNNLSSNALHNFGKGKLLSECKKDEPLKNLIGKVPAPPPF